MVGRSVGWLLDRMLGYGVVGWGGWMLSRASTDGERKPCDMSPALPTHRHVCPFARFCGRFRWIVVGFVGSGEGRKLCKSHKILHRKDHANLTNSYENL